MYLPAVGSAARKPRILRKSSAKLKGEAAMARPRSIPSYRRHKQSGQGVTTLTDALGRRYDVLLGAYGTKESRIEYARVIAEWEAAGRAIPEPKAADLSMNELILRFWPHAEQHYRRPDGTTTNELNDFRLSLQPLKRLYGHTLAKDFGPIALEAVRKAMVTGSHLTEKEKEERTEEGRPLTLSRGVVNQRVGRIRRLFRWAVSKELVPAPVLTALSALKGLERGRSDARETEPVAPVPVAFVEATLPHLLPTVADMVMVQLLTGARPGEICDLRACDIDMTGKVWLYKPASHKTAYRGLPRVIPIGPRAQEIIRRRLKPNVQAYLFSPQEAMQEKWERDRQMRKTKVYPCEKRRRGPRKVTDHYSTVNYTISIRRAIQKANKAGKTIPHWHPHQLRHTKATEIRREAGLDAARAVLGHRSPVVTEVYAELDINKAAEVMERLG
jgi:integrase